MSSNVKRILISFLFSLLGIAGTYFYFQKINPVLSFSFNQKPLAQIENLENTSRKKLAEHRTWQVVEFGDSLYSGEMIKTSSDSELQIRFLETNAILNLEADSAITIQKTKDRISIGLVSGNLFIDSSKNENGGKLSLESERGLINLTQGSGQFSKQSGQAAQFNLLSGTAQQTDASGKSSELNPQSDALVIKSPSNLSAIESNLPEVRLKWSGANSFKASDLIFKSGVSRKQLKVLAAKLDANHEALVPISFGRNTVSIFSKNNSGVEVELASVRFLLKPSLLAIERATPMPVPIPVVVEKPKAQIVWVGDSSNLQPFAKDPEISLSWQVKNKDAVKKVKIKILDGEQVIVSKELSAGDTEFKTFVKKPGRYVASVEAFGEDSEKLATSSLRSIVAEEFPYLPKPQWVNKDTNEKAQLNGSFASSWNEQAGALNYKLQLKDSSGRIVKEWVQKRTSFALKGLLPGKYTLSLAAIDLYQRESPQKAIKTIQVLDNSEILAPKLKSMRFK